MGVTNHLLIRMILHVDVKAYPKKVTLQRKQHITGSHAAGLIDHHVNSSNYASLLNSSTGHILNHNFKSCLKNKLVSWRLQEKHEHFHHMAASLWTPVFYQDTQWWELLGQSQHFVLLGYDWCQFFWRGQGHSVRPTNKAAKRRPMAWTLKVIPRSVRLWS